MPNFSTLPEAALYAEENGHPASWVRKVNGGYDVTKPRDNGKKKTKKKAPKRRTKKRATKKRPAKKKATKKRPTKKRPAKKKTAKKRAKPGAWGQSVVGTTPRAKFFRSQRSSGASKKQAAARWKFKSRKR